ncbi:MAG: site-specific DNA-methyltransferase [Sphingopyxis sp.]|nr:site-specific DNA-methyltransferase [Sphingopyxis sp.]
MIGNACLYLGDAYEIRPQLGRMDCDCMDPPYKLNTSGGGKMRASRPYMDQIAEEGLDQDFDHNIINPLLCGSAVVFLSDEQLTTKMRHLEGGFARVKLCAWRKLTPMPVANKSYVAECEWYAHAWQEGYHPLGDLADKKRVIDCRSRQDGMALYEHATVKPDLVMDKIMRNVNGDRICDPFMGTGSTGVAAIKAGKHFWGIEHNPKHFATAIKRITEAVERYQPCIESGQIL